MRESLRSKVDFLRGGREHLGVMTLGYMQCVKLYLQSHDTYIYIADLNQRNTNSLLSGTYYMISLACLERLHLNRQLFQSIENYFCLL